MPYNNPKSYHHEVTAKKKKIAAVNFLVIFLSSGDSWETEVSFGSVDRFILFDLLWVEGKERNPEDKILSA